MASCTSQTEKDVNSLPEERKSSNSSVDSICGEPVKRSFSFLSNVSSSASSDDSEDKNKQTVVISNRLDDILQCSKAGSKNQMILITSASYPFHVEWANSDWSRKCGWSSDEVLGLDCKFLQGDATDMKKIRIFMRDLMVSGGRATLDILNYNKDNTLSHNTSYCMPIVDDCGHDNAQEVSHIAIVLQRSVEVHHSSECSALLEGRVLEEVGLPLDRREGCNVYPHRQVLPPPVIDDWLRLTDGLPLALMLRYMLRTEAPIVLIDREGRIVHVNVGWVSLTGYSGMDSEGRYLQSILDNAKDPFGSENFVQLMAWLNAQNSFKMHVNVNLTKKARHPSSPASRRNSIRSSSSNGLFGSTATMLESDSVSSLPESSGAGALRRQSTATGRKTHSPSRRSTNNSTVSILNFNSPPQSTVPVVSRADSQVSLLSSPKISRRTTASMYEGDSFPCQLSPVAIGAKHFAVLCIPTPTSAPVCPTSSLPFGMTAADKSDACSNAERNSTGTDSIAIMSNINGNNNSSNNTNSPPKDVFLSVSYRTVCQQSLTFPVPHLEPTELAATA